MLKRLITTAAVLAFVAILATTASPARADKHVKFSGDKLDLDYDYAGGGGGNKWMVIESTATTSVNMWLLDTSGPTILDGAELANAGATKFVLDVLFTQNGTNDWSATGTLILKDSSREVAKADFTSTSVATVTIGEEDFFRMSGALDPFSTNTAILEAASSPWTFVGTANYPSGAGNGSDGTANQISLTSWAGYNQGTVLTTQFLIAGYVDEDTFLGSDKDLDGGWGTGTIVPVPGAVILGVVGLGLVGWRMRRYA